MLLYNTPGEHYPRSNGCMLHYIGEMLTQHCTIAGPKVEHNSWRIVAQTSSIGLVGETREQWLTTQFLRTLASNTESPYYPTIRTPTPVKFSLVYPTINNCLQGYLGHRSAICGKYERGLRQLQYWLLSSMWFVYFIFLVLFFFCERLTTVGGKRTELIVPRPCRIPSATFVFHPVGKRWRSTL